MAESASTNEGCAPLFGGVAGRAAKNRKIGALRFLWPQVALPEVSRIFRSFFCGPGGVGGGERGSQLAFFNSYNDWPGPVEFN